MHKYLSIDPMPLGKSGAWEITQIEVDANLAASHNFVEKVRGTDRFIAAGIHQRLMRDDLVIMDDSLPEVRDLIFWMGSVQGTILINGLGLGVAVRLLLKSDRVQRIVVIEQSPDVIHLVGKNIQDPRLSIIEEDAFKYQPELDFYDYVWHDIWDHITSNNVEEMDLLRSKYKGICRWQGCWCEDACRNGPPDKSMFVESKLV